MTIRPNRRSIIAGSTFWVHSTAPVRLTDRTSCQCASVISWKGTRLPSTFGEIPALLTSTDTGPNSAATSSMKRDTRSAARRSTAAARRWESGNRAASWRSASAILSAPLPQ